MERDGEIVKDSGFRREGRWPAKIVKIWDGRRVPMFTVSEVVALFGDKWPKAGGFDFEMLHCFALMEQGILQGVDGSGEPIGPCVEFTIRAVPLTEKIIMGTRP